MSQPSAESQNLPRTSRYEFLDLLRGVAVLMMIEGHAMRALLDHRIRATFAYDIHELFHGLPAPIFLFAAGAAFAFTLETSADLRRVADPAADRKRNWRRRRRLLNVLLMAYGLQLSYFSLRQTFFSSTPEQFVILLNFNVLQCIVISVLALRWLSTWASSQKSLVRICIGLALGMGLATPLVWAIAPSLPMWVGTVLSRHYSSYFPLFPYAAFTFAGAAWGVRFQMACTRNEESRFLQLTIVAGGVGMVVSTLLAGIPWPPLYAEFWWSSPWYLWLRIGLLALLGALFRRMEIGTASNQGSNRGRALHLLALLGRQSFYIYIAHLLVLYGSAYNPRWNMLRKLGTNLPFWESAVATALLVLIMIFSAMFWDWAKKAHSVRANQFKWALATYLIIVFIIS